MRLRKAGLIALAILAASAEAQAANPSCFAQGLPADIRERRLDDAKLLTGWVFDVAAAHHALRLGEIIDRHSGLSHVPGFAGATDLTGLRGRYRIMRPPFDAGHGYYGIEIAVLDARDRPSSLFLINRLFRLPVVLHQPIGVATDIATNAALLFGWRAKAITDANNAAAVAAADAVELQVPLLTVGQSQAGGIAQLQAAYLATQPRKPRLTGFVTMNAAHVDASVRQLHMSPDAVNGINFVKDLDPGFGPRGLLPNRIGLQVYIHPDGSGTARPGPASASSAWMYAGQHMLSTFNNVSLTAALAHALAQGLCPIAPN